MFGLRKKQLQQSSTMASDSYDPSKPNLVQVHLTTRIKTLQCALETSSRVNDGVAPVNLNCGLTWEQLFQNLEIPVSLQQHMIRGKDKKKDVICFLTDKISKFTEQFQGKLDRYSVRIVSSVKANNLNPTSFRDVSVESNRTAAVNGQNKRRAESINASPAKRSRGRPPKSDTPAARKSNNVVTAGAKKFASNLAAAKNLASNLSAAGPSGQQRENRQTNIKSQSKTTAVQNGIEVDLTNGASDDNEDEMNFDTESQLSVFTVCPRSRRQLGASPVGSDSNHNGVDVKAAVIQSMMKNLSNTVLWRMKKEVDDLKENGKWIKIIQYIPRIGHLISDVFDEKHFK